MAGINKVMLMGRVYQDSELEYVENRRPTFKFILETVETIIKGSGTVDIKELHSVIMMNTPVETATKYFKKGAYLFIEGKVRTRTALDQSNNKKTYITEIFADSFTQMLNDRHQF